MPSWLETLVDGYNEDPETKQLLQQLAVTSPNAQGYSLEARVIRYKGRIWVGQNLLAQ